MEIEIVKEERRGCGYRHSGPDGVGLYLVGDGVFEYCERIPFPLSICPACGHGLKFSRGFTWITPAVWFDPTFKPPCRAAIMDLAGVMAKNHNHEGCYMCNPPDSQHGLMWVGEKFYTPGSFMNEAVTRGISKRIATIPKGFKVGETVVYLAHKKVIPTEKESLAAVFTVFKPSRVEIVVDVEKEEDLPGRAKLLAKRLGDKARLIKVLPPCEQQNLFEGK